MSERRWAVTQDEKGRWCAKGRIPADPRFEAEVKVERRDDGPRVVEVVVRLKPTRRRAVRTIDREAPIQAADSNNESPAESRSGVQRPTNYFTRSHPTNAFTHSALTQVPFAEMAAAAMSKALGEEPPASPHLVTPLPHPGRRGHGDLYYVEWAQLYIAALNHGSRAPIRDLAERHELSRNQVRSLIDQAAARGLLNRSGRGVTGARLTKKARDLLQQNEHEEIHDD